jgi:hypothetical protein
VPASLVRLEDSDVDNTEDKIQDKKHGSDGHIRYNRRTSAEALKSRRIRRTLGMRILPLVDHQSQLPRSDLVMMELHTDGLDGSWVVDISHSSPNTRNKKSEARSQTQQARNVGGPTYI